MQLHHVHLWEIDEHWLALDAHLELEQTADPAKVKAAVRRLLNETYGIPHCTLETASVSDTPAAHGRIGCS